MKHKRLFFLLIFVTLFSCKEPEARRPKSQSTTTFYKELIEKNKQLIKQENSYIEQFIKRDTTNVYKTSSTGFWYAYINKIEEDLTKPKPEDVVVIEYNITDLQDNVIYPKQEKIYKIDKEDFIPALQDGIKLMKVGETVTFIIPSYRGFGITGDEEKIEGNTTIKSTLTLKNIKSN